MTGKWRQQSVCNFSAGHFRQSLYHSHYRHANTYQPIPENKNYFRCIKNNILCRLKEAAKVAGKTETLIRAMCFLQAVNYVIPCTFPTKVERQIPETSCVPSHTSSTDNVQHDTVTHKICCHSHSALWTGPCVSVFLKIKPVETPGGSSWHPLWFYRGSLTLAYLL